MKLVTVFCTSLFKKPTPSQINFIKNAKNHFLLVKKLKNTGSAQLCILVSITRAIEFLFIYFLPMQWYCKANELCLLETETDSLDFQLARSRDTMYFCLPAREFSPFFVYEPREHNTLLSFSQPISHTRDGHGIKNSSVSR